MHIAAAIANYDILAVKSPKMISVCSPLLNPIVDTKNKGAHHTHTALDRGDSSPLSNKVLLPVIIKYNSPLYCCINY